MAAGGGAAAGSAPARGSQLSESDSSASDSDGVGNPVDGGSQSEEPVPRSRGVQPVRAEYARIFHN